MEKLLLLATAQGLVVCTPGEKGWEQVQRGLIGQHVTSVIAREGVILAGTRDGVYRSDDLGKSWQRASDGLAIHHVRWLAYHPDISDFEFAGTEPAGIFVSRDGAKTWRACPEVAELRDQHGWSLPYSPEAGCVRGFAFQDERAYAAVEDGGVLVSEDRGEHWRLAGGSRGRPDHHPPEPYLHSDVHSIETHRETTGLVCAATGGGFYWSQDGGKTWNGLYKDCYCRAVWIDSEDPGHMILGPADGVDYNGRIEETHDSGNTWVPASGTLRTPWRQHMVERFTQAGDELLAVLSNGELLSTPLANLDWQPILPGIRGVAATTLLEE